LNGETKCIEKIDIRYQGGIAGSQGTPHSRLIMDRHQGEASDYAEIQAGRQATLSCKRYFSETQPRAKCAVLEEDL
jgi:hypothetical protein